MGLALRVEGLGYLRKRRSLDALLHALEEEMVELAHVLLVPHLDRIASRVEQGAHHPRGVHHLAIAETHIDEEPLQLRHQLYRCLALSLFALCGLFLLARRYPRNRPGCR